MAINYAKMIKKYRKTKFLTQVELSQILGVGINNVTRWESGAYEPTIKVKKRLYQLFIDAGMKVEE